jgi:hypothetical protein
MTKKILVVLFLLVLNLILFVNPHVLFAQEDSSNINMFCLHASEIDDHEHIAQLTGVGLFASKPVQVWRKVEAGFQCAIDINGQSSCGDDSLTVGDDFKLLDLANNQVIADAGGNISLRVKSYTPSSQTHLFYAVQFGDNTADSNSEATEATTVALKLATFVPEQPTGQGEPENCVSIRWDPYGRVFDAVSLEPIPNIAVTLLDKDKVVIPTQPGIKNPFIVAEDGAFSFFVEDGTYFLKPDTINFQFPVSATILSSLKNRQDVYTDLYSGEPIVQKGKIEHRDIPLVPINPNKPTNNPVKIMTMEITSFKEEGKSYQMVYGTVSHPKSLIYAYSGVRAIGYTEADNYGKFDLYIDNSAINQDQDIDIQAKKVNLDKTTNTVYAEVDSAQKSIKPVPSFLIGHLYDKDGRIIPNAQVEIVVPQMNNKTLTTLKSDKNGYLFIPASVVPPTNYKLKISNYAGNLVNELSTDQFINQNKKYLTDNRLNLFDSTTAKKIETDTKFRNNLASQKPNFNSSLPTREDSASDAVEVESGSNIFIILTIVIALSLGALALFMYKVKAKLPPLS